MGIYTSNSVLTEAHDWASEIEADTRYDASLGCAQILADCTRNDMALFEATILNDIAEVRAVQEGVEVVTEAAFSNVIKKLVEMFKKLLAKIKGIFSAFLAKLNGAFRNGKDLVKKYEKQIVKYSNWKGFKVKGIRKPKQDDIQGTIDKFFTGTGETKPVYKIDSKCAIESNLEGYTDAEKIKDADLSDIKDALAKKYTHKVASDVASMHDDLMDHFFDDSEAIDDDNINGSYFSKSWIKGILQNDKWEKDVKKFNDRIEKNINTVIDNLSKTEDNIAKFMANKDNSANGKYKGMDAVGINAAQSDGDKIKKDTNQTIASKDKGMDAEKAQKAVQALQKLASAEQEIVTKYTSEYMGIVKFTLAQARKVWSAAAAWSSGVHKESAEYAEAMGEVMADQLYAAFEA